MGGVGGAILVGAIALVLWRMHSRKQKQAVKDEDDVFAGPGDSLMREKHTSNPFKKNLDQYHNPGGTVNTASNF